MPDNLITKIRELITKNPSNRMLDTIWVTCEGENPADRENIGELEYYSPAFKNDQFQGIPAYYFPYKKQKNYKAPFIFVKFIKPQYNVLIQIECKAWAKNIIPNRQERLGSVHFELMIDWTNPYWIGQQPSSFSIVVPSSWPKNSILVKLVATLCNKQKY